MADHGIQRSEAGFEPASFTSRGIDAAAGAGYTGHKLPWDAFWGQRYAVVADPDGNLIDLFAHNS